MSFVLDREIPLAEVLPARAVNALAKNQIDTLNELIRLIETRGIADGSTRGELSDGLEVRPDHGHFPLAEVGPGIWQTVLRMLDQIGFDWRHYALETSPTLGAIRELNADELTASIIGKMSELIRLLAWYQARVQHERVDAAQLDLFTAAEPAAEGVEP